MFKGDKRAMKKVCRQDIQILEGQALGACKVAYHTLLKKINNGKLFSGFTLEERLILWHEIQLCSATRLIPSLGTFFSDWNYIKYPIESITNLVALPLELPLPDTILQMLCIDSSECYIQRSRSSFTTIELSSSDRSDIQYRQLWIAAMRNYVDLPLKGNSKRKSAKPRAKANNTALIEFARLAQNLGF